MEDKIKISLAPLQGYTDWVYREAFKKCIGGIDEFYTPFLVLQNKGEVKTSHRREVEPFIDRNENLVPQFLAGSVKEFQYFGNYFTDLGYQKMNWNLGCPFPMVTRKKKGSGLLPYPDLIKDILTESYSGKLDLSIKTRLGLEDNSDISSVLEVLQSFEIDEIIVHPRFSKQMYKGNVDLDCFEELIQRFQFNFAYNGDIQTVKQFKEIRDKFPGISHVMIGRGVLNDCWLPLKIKGVELPTLADRKELLRKMHNEIFQTYSSYLSGDTQLLQKLKPFWEYFSNHFEQERKVYKAVKKAVNLKKYDEAVAFAFSQNIKE